MIHISPLLPAGTDALEGLQSRRAFPPDEAGMEQWRMSVDSATDDFAFANRGQTTLIEHEDYMMKINRYLVAEGHGSFVRAKICTDTKFFGELAPERNSDGSIKVIEVEMILAMLGDMATGSDRMLKAE